MQAERKPARATSLCHHRPLFCYHPSFKCAFTPDILLVSQQFHLKTYRSYSEKNFFLWTLSNEFLFLFVDKFFKHLTIVWFYNWLSNYLEKIESLIRLLSKSNHFHDKIKLNKPSCIKITSLLIKTRNFTIRIILILYAILEIVKL